jgi:transposase
MDESGLLMAPLARSSWAPRGRPPGLAQRAGHREKVSVAALWLSPRRDRLGLAFQARANAYFDSAAVADFLRGAVPGLGGPVVVVWDGGPMHRGDPIRELLAESGGRVDLERLPPYAPELMPVEQVWTWLKYGRLSNWAPADARELASAAERELSSIRDDQRRLRNFFHACDLPLPRTLLT